MTYQAQIETPDGRTSWIYSFTCDRCHKVKTHDQGLSTGYGRDPETDRPICFDCCGEVDKERMIETGEIVLYLTMEDRTVKGMGLTPDKTVSAPSELTNWPGSLRFKILDWSKGRHNWGLDRYDLWFKGPDDRVWYGRFQGSWTQLTYCRRTKHTGISGYVADRHGLTV